MMSTLTSYKCKGYFDPQGVATYLLSIIAAIVVLAAIVMAFSGCAATDCLRQAQAAEVRADSLNRVNIYWKRQHEEMDAYIRTLYMDPRGKHLIDSLDAVDRTVGSGYVK